MNITTVVRTLNFVHLFSKFDAVNNVFETKLQCLILNSFHKRNMKIESISLSSLRNLYGNSALILLLHK